MQGTSVALRAGVDRHRGSSCPTRGDRAPGDDAAWSPRHDPARRSQDARRGDEAAGHEAAGAYRLTGPRHLPHLHDPAGCDDLDATTGSRGDDFEGLDALPSVDHCFDSVTFHEANDTPDVPRRRAKPRDDQWIVPV